MRRLVLAMLTLVLLSAACSQTGERITVSAVFADVGDLVPKAGVQSSDVRIGTVEKIELDGYVAKVTMSIDGRAGIGSDARALIRSTSLLGEKFIDLAAADDGRERRPPLRDGDVIPIERTAKIASLDDALLKLGQILEGGDAADLGVFINSTAKILDGKQDQLGQLFGELEALTSTVASHAPEIGSALESLDSAFGSLASTADLGETISSSANVADILADQQKDLDSLLVSLDTFASASASYTSQTTDANDSTLKNIRLILDQLMTATRDLDMALSSLARYSELWPKAIPGDYIQLDVVVESGSALGPASTAPKSAPTAADLSSIIWRPMR